jgi:hypothetical protein
VQGFRPDDAAGSREIRIENATGPSPSGRRNLALHFTAATPADPARAAVDVFTPSRQVAEYFEKRGYALLASPRLYDGQTVTARVIADARNPAPVAVGLYINVYQGDQDLRTPIPGPQSMLAPGADGRLSWRIPPTGGAPIAQVGLAIYGSDGGPADGAVHLDHLTWDGPPDVVLTRPEGGGTMWQRAWVNAVDQFDTRRQWPFNLIQNCGRGMLISGTRDWADYEAACGLTVHLAKAAGIAVRVQGLRRYYALLLCDDGMARLVKTMDGEVSALAQTAWPWSFGQTARLSLRAAGNRLIATIDGIATFDVADADHPLDSGGVAFVLEDGRLTSDAMTVRP